MLIIPALCVSAWLDMTLDDLCVDDDDDDDDDDADDDAVSLDGFNERRGEIDDSFSLLLLIFTAADSTLIESPLSI